MESKIALIGIIVEEFSASQQVNRLLHEYGEHIVGRMGIPYRDKGLHIISIVMDADSDAISALSGKLGKLEGVSVKTVQAHAAGEAKA